MSLRGVAQMGIRRSGSIQSPPTGTSMPSTQHEVVPSLCVQILCFAQWRQARGSDMAFQGSFDEPPCPLCSQVTCTRLDAWWKHEQRLRFVLSDLEGESEEDLRLDGGAVQFWTTALRHAAQAGLTPANACRPEDILQYLHHPVFNVGPLALGCARALRVQAADDKAAFVPWRAGTVHTWARSPSPATLSTGEWVASTVWSAASALVFGAAAVLSPPRLPPPPTTRDVWVQPEAHAALQAAIVKAVDAAAGTGWALLFLDCRAVDGSAVTAGDHLPSLPCLPGCTLSPVLGAFSGPDVPAAALPQAAQEWAAATAQASSALHPSSQAALPACLLLAVHDVVASGRAEVHDVGEAGPALLPPPHDDQPLASQAAAGRVKASVTLHKALLRASQRRRDAHRSRLSARQALSQGHRSEASACLRAAAAAEAAATHATSLAGKLGLVLGQVDASRLTGEVVASLGSATTALALANAQTTPEDVRRAMEAVADAVEVAEESLAVVAAPLPGAELDEEAALAELDQAIRDDESAPSEVPSPAAPPRPAFEAGLMPTVPSGTGAALPTTQALPVTSLKECVPAE